MEGITVWIGGLPEDTEVEDVEEFLNGYGRLLDVQVRSSNRDCFAFVTFEEEIGASLALKDLDNHQFFKTDHYVRLEISKKKNGGPPPRGKHNTQRSRSPRHAVRDVPQHPSYDDSRRRPEPRNSGHHFDGVTLWLGGLPQGIREREVENFCKGFGKITKIRIRSSERDVFAFVDFADAQLGREAVGELDQAKWSRNSQNIIQVRVSETSRPNKDREKHATPSPSPIRRPRKNRKHRLELRNLPPDMEWDELKDIARDLGESVEFANVFVKSGLKCGVIEYNDREDAEYACSYLHRRRVDGHHEKLEVTLEP